MKIKCILSPFLILIFFLILRPSAEGGTFNSVNFTIEIPDIAANDGEVQILKVKVKDNKKYNNLEVTGKVFGLNFPFYSVNSMKGEYQGIIAVPLGVAKGSYIIQFKMSEGTKSELIEVPYNVNLLERASEAEILDVYEEAVLPKKTNVVERISREEEDLLKIYMSVSKKKYWNGSFKLPVKGSISSRFAVYRLYTKHLRRRTHWGIDYRVPVGTPVKASAAGKIVFAKDLYFSGKTVLIDHGFGLYTGYSHLDSFKVKLGAIVRSEQLIGRSGKSGKVTGAHLHWMAIVARVKVDPKSLLSIGMAK